MSGTIGGLFHVALCLAFPVYFHQAVVGASAGIFGLGAAFAASMPNQSISVLIYFIFPVTMRAKWLLVVGAGISVIGLFLGGGVAHGAHLGGMLTGVAWIKWGSWLESLGGSWGAGTRRRAARPMVRAGVLRTARRPGKIEEELPPAEFISREVDPILDKISAQGIHSLTERERDILEAARNRMARR